MTNDPAEPNDPSVAASPDSPADPGRAVDRAGPVSRERTPLHLFEAFGVELEYMLVDRHSLDVRPVADRLIHQVTGRYDGDVEHDDVTWSNELVLHVIELKTTRPAPSLSGLHQTFQTHVSRVSEQLRPLGCRLMPSAMHPWMDPDREMHLWPHDCGEIYQAFHRVFDCRGHGWANLQSVHLNLPFHGDEEFGRLHAAVRLILPLLPALAAASPVMDGRRTGLLDNRLEVYRTNSRKIPSVAGRIIPEPAFTQAEYRRQILDPLFADIAPHDPDGVLRDEFLNARGAIARFSRGSIEIRVIDIQECPAADLAVLQATVAVLKALVAERFSRLADQQAAAVEPLSRIFIDTIRNAGGSLITDNAYLKLLGVTGPAPCRAADLWKRLLDAAPPETDEATGPALETILTRGPLAQRMLTRLPPGNEPLPRELLTALYRELCDCLATGRLFDGV